MKKLLLYSVFVCCSLSVLSQERLTRIEKNEFQDADFFFYQDRFAEAYTILSALHQTHPDEPEIAYRLGVCELELYQNVHKSKPLLEIALQSGNNEAIFYLARILHLEYEFDEAIRLFESYKNKGKREFKESEVNQWINACQQAIQLTKHPEDVMVRNLGSSINSSFAEYVPLITANEDELYFTSRRDNSTGGLLDPNELYFEDIYYSKKEDGKWTSPINTIPEVNTASHDATAAISSDGNSMVIYRTNKQLTGGDLYITTKLNENWTEPKLLDDNINSDFQEASACFSPDGNSIYFSSNRPEGLGGKDIYRVKLLPNGEWSLPKNLGPTINTALDEDSPFMDIDGRTLYFASEGHNSMGGYDIFTSKRQGKENWTKPDNLGFPANTVGDDIYLSMTPGGRKGYYSSVQENGYGDQDLYEINFIYRQKTNLIIKGELTDTEGNPLKGEITVIDQRSNELQGIYSSNERNGKYILILNPMVNYTIHIQADGKEVKTKEIYFDFPEENNTELTMKSISLE